MLLFRIIRKYYIFSLRVSLSASLPAAPRRLIVSPAMAAPLPPHAASFSPAAPRTAAEAIAVDLDRAEVGRPRACDREQTNVSTGEVLFFTDENTSESTNAAWEDPMKKPR